MKLKSLLSCLLLFNAIILFGQAKVSTDTSVIVIPHWKKGEAHHVRFVNTTIYKKDGKETRYPTTFEALFTVLQKDTSGYLVEWVYTKCDLAPNDNSAENQLLAKMLNTRFACKLTITGRFKELINSDEIKILSDRALDELVKSSANDPAMNIQYRAAKQLSTSKAGLETLLLKQVKFYNFSFGFKYKINFVQTNRLKIPNSFGGQAFDGIEKVQLIKLDNINSVCVIETKKTADNEQLAKELAAYLKKLAAQSGTELKYGYEKEKLEYSESTMHQIQFMQGIVQKARFTRVLNVGVEHRTTLIECETLD